MQFQEKIVQQVEKDSHAMMRDYGISYETGFMPEKTCPELPRDTGNAERDRYFGMIHRMASSLPRLTKNNGVASAVRKLPLPTWSADGLTNEVQYHLFLDVSMVAQAYLRENLKYKTVQELLADESIKRLPAQLAVPLYEIGEIKGKDPSMSYIELGIWNHTKTDNYDPAKPEDFHTIHLFTENSDESDEGWFLRVHQSIQATEAPAYPHLLRAYLLSQYPFEQIPAGYMAQCLNAAVPPLLKRVAVLKRMGERVNPVIYFDKVRMFYPFPLNVIYEGVKQIENQPQNFGGQTGGNRQSQQVEDNIMQVLHSEPSQEYRSAMRQKMPRESRELLLRLGSSRVRDYVLANRGNPDLVMGNNLVVFAMVDWGIEHDEQAFGNIGKFGEARGTGGPHLTLLRDMFMARRNALIY